MVGPPVPTGSADGWMVLPGVQVASSVFASAPAEVFTVVITCFLSSHSQYSQPWLGSYLISYWYPQNPLSSSLLYLTQEYPWVSGAVGLKKCSQKVYRLLHIGFNQQICQAGDFYIQFILGFQISTKFTWSLQLIIYHDVFFRTLFVASEKN